MYADISRVITRDLNSKHGRNNFGAGEIMDLRASHITGQFIHVDGGYCHLDQILR